MFRRGRRVDMAAIAEHMRPAVAAWLNAHVQILRPAEDDEGTMTVLYDSGPGGALIQPIRSAAPITVGTQATNIQSIRIQAVRPADGLSGDTSGLRVRVLDGGENRDLEQLVYASKGQPGTSHQWGLILEATVVTSARWV